MVLLPILSVLLLACHSSTAQQQPVLRYLEIPIPAWSMETGSRVETEVALSPDGTFMVVAGNDCTMTAFSLDGMQLWKYTPTDVAALIYVCDGGILFGTSITGVPYAARAQPNGLNSQIVAVSTADGNTPVYSVGPIPGVVAGTPRITQDQRYLIVASNSDGLTQGHFTVWDLATATDSMIPLFQFDAPNSTEPQPFGPIGFQWNPIQGYYDGGFDNSNDIFVWGIDNELSDPAAGEGQIFAFQFPVGGMVDALNGTMDELNVTLVGEPRAFQNPTAPVFGNEGLRMYWTVTRNDIRCWIGEEDLARSSFDKRGIVFSDTIVKDDNNRANTGLDSPVVTKNGVFGPLAANQIFRVDPLCLENSLSIFNTNASVNSMILPSLDEEFVFFATVEPDSKLYMLNATSLDPVWEHQLDRGVEADMALSPDGTTVFVVSASGVLEAITVASLVAVPTQAPAVAAAPTMSGTVTPGPTLSPSLSVQPSVSPKPISALISAPIPAPTTIVPTASPLAQTVIAPTRPASSGWSPSVVAVVLFQVCVLVLSM